MVRGRRLRLSIVVLVGLLGLTAGFTWKRFGAAKPSAPGTVSYELAWSWEGARWDERRKDYSFRTDRGYDVRISAAYIGVASVELVPCRPDAAVTPLKAALELLLPAQAAAAHGYVHDSSLVEAPVVDSAFTSKVVAFGSGKTAGKAYCQVHELIVPLEQTAPDGFRLERWSAFVRGSFTLPGGDAEQPFEAHVNLKGGALVDLEVPAELPPGGLTVRVTRNALHAFDGPALEKLSSSELAYAFMRGLTKGTRAAVVAGE